LSSTIPIEVPTPPSAEYVGVVPQLIQRAEPGWAVSFTCTQHVEPGCIASHSVTLLQGLILALPSGVATALPAGLFRLDRLRRRGGVSHGGAAAFTTARGAGEKKKRRAHART
jgi:hypothetical protein